MQGLDNGLLYEFAQTSFDLCFTRDGGFPAMLDAATSFGIFQQKESYP